jgi:hypothetical protein
METIEAHFPVYRYARARAWRQTEKNVSIVSIVYLQAA